MSTVSVTPSSTSTAAGAPAGGPQLASGAGGPVSQLPRSSQVTSRRITHVKRQRARQSYRFFRAYWTTFLVLQSYLGHFFFGRFFGRAWLSSRMDAVHARNARRVNGTIVELQGLFIKVGQLLSVMANFLPEPFRAGLATLQDRVPPRPTHEVKGSIEREFGKTTDELFSYFSDEPLASASLGQVHEARVVLPGDVERGHPDGTRVAVKVQHADIDEIVRLDLKTIRRIMGIVTWFVPVKNLDVYYRQIKTMIAEELDFAREASNIERIAKNFTPEGGVEFPRPVGHLSTKTVMTTTFVVGTQIGDVKRLDANGVDRKALAKKIVETFCQMIFVDGLYHADPHPGNMLAGPNGELILLDFGAVAELSQEMKEGIPEFIEGVIRRDTDRLIKSLRKMGFIARNQTEDTSERIVEFFHQRFQEEIKLESFNLKDIKIDAQRGIDNFLSLRKMNIGLKELSEAFHVPRDWVFLERTILLLTGVCTTLDPEMNPVGIIKPYVEDFVLGNRDFAQIAMEAAKDMAMKAVTLPEDFKKYLMRANRGEAEVKVKDLGRAAGVVYSGIRQAVLAAIAIAAAVIGTQFYLAGKLEIANYMFIGSGTVLGITLLAMLLTRSK